MSTTYEHVFYAVEGQHAKKLEAAEEVGRRTAFVDSLLKSSKSKDAMQDIATKFTDIPVDEITVEGGTQSDGKLLHEKQKVDSKSLSLHCTKLF